LGSYGLGGFGLGSLGLGGYGLGSYGLGGYGYGRGLGYGYGYGGAGYGYGSSAYSPYYSSAYSTPQYSFYPSNIVVQQPTYVPQGPPAIPAGSAQVEVVLPDPNAKVWFDGALTQQTGVDRFFHTPALSPNSTSTYRVRASWMQDGSEVVQERVVSVTPGQTSVADFR
jgi:uncharacterized protein (TIGR03000 family)